MFIALWSSAYPELSLLRRFNPCNDRVDPGFSIPVERRQILWAQTKLHPVGCAAVRLGILESELILHFDEELLDSLITIYMKSSSQLMPLHQLV